MQQKFWRSQLPGKITLVVVLAILGLCYMQRNAVYDYWRLYNYHPQTAITMLATEATMTPKAQHLFYINHPAIESRSDFSTYCPAGTEQTVVLGCYKSNQRGIYVLNVSNRELAGIKQVTAAHEMLHAAYDRLGEKDKQRINSMLIDYYNHQLTDDAIKQTIDAYKKSEPDAVVNEMHSIFGTEIANLPPELQQYYSQYFNHRAAVTGYYQTYEAAFTRRQQQIKSYDNQLDTLKTQIDSLNNTVGNQQTALKTQRQALDSARSSDANSYNQQVDAYNAAVNNYNANVHRLQGLISEYNQIVASRNAIALEEHQLVQSLSAPSLTQ